MSREQTMISMMEETRRFDPPVELSQRARITSMDQYREMYRKSLDDPETFWGDYAQELEWFEKWGKVLEGDFQTGRIKWFPGGKLNASYNCLDRHLKAGRQDRVALRWEAESGESIAYTYGQLHREVCRFSNILKQRGVQKGDRIVLYLPMIPQLLIAVLACSRIGAIHSCVFSGFSTDSLRQRILDCGAKLVITANYRLHNSRAIPCKKNVDEALSGCPEVRCVIVVRRLQQEVDMSAGRDFFWEDLAGQKELPSSCPAEPMDSE